MAMISSEVILTSVFMALEGAFAYSAFLPSIMTIGTFVDSEQKITMIRQGEFVGALFLIGLSVTVAFLMRSIWPLLLGLVAGMLAIAVYEYALRQSPPGIKVIVDARNDLWHGMTTLLSSTLVKHSTGQPIQSRV